MFNALPSMDHRPLLQVTLSMKFAWTMKELEWVLQHGPTYNHGPGRIGEHDLTPRRVSLSCFMKYHVKLALLLLARCMMFQLDERHNCSGYLKDLCAMLVQNFVL
jgi:hypothetical protein